MISVSVLHKLKSVFPPIKELGDKIIKHLNSLMLEFANDESKENVKRRIESYLNELQRKNLPDISLSELKRDQIKKGQHEAAI